MLKHWIILFSIFNLSTFYLKAQVKPKSSNEIRQGLEKLKSLGSVLYFAAHPDDENTRLIAWLAQEKKYRTAYLSLTRGDGGQNLIGTEQGVDLGLIRTQELLAARNMDKGEQFFSSAYDFGFSKTHDETFSFWDKETALREAVYIIRKLRPDVIINRFPPDSRGGHGHHQASAILSHEAFLAAADPNMFPEQLQEVSPWKAKRLLWNTANFGGANNTSEDQLKIDIGDYNPLLGQSYGEIAAQSRSQHKSQGFGAAAHRGRSIEYFAHVDGSQATTDIMDGINTTWKRIPQSKHIEQLIDKLIKDFNPLNPELSLNDLFALKKRVQHIEDNYWRTQKTKEIDELIIACAGLWIDANAATPQYPVHTSFYINIEAIVRNPHVKIEIVKINNNTFDNTLETNILWSTTTKTTWASITQPYWLLEKATLGKYHVAQKDLGNPENKDKPKVKLTLKINNQVLEIDTDIKYKFVDPVRGEIYQDIAIIPQLTASLSTDNILCVNNKAKTITVTFSRNDPSIKHFTVEAEQQSGWQITPRTIELNFEKENTISKEIEIKPLAENSRQAKLCFTWKNEILHSIKTIQYDHIPSITWFPNAQAKIENLNIDNPIHKVAYIAGAGDLVPQSLQQIGIATTILDDNQINLHTLQQYDAVIVGVRYFNIKKESNKTLESLLEYVKEGGTVLVQYNVNTRLQTNKYGPYAFTISRNRVTEEDALVSFDKNDPAFRYPNRITEQDFEGWIQERGLYFADQIDSNYRTPILINDKNEQANNGSLLIANYGKGKFVYTSLAFFRQLPAGVPGAYRLFVNLLSREK